MGLGAENFWDDVFHDRLRQGQQPSYDGGPAFLFEVNPQLMPPGIENELFQMRVRGQLPVMAHPERYVAIQGEIAAAERIGRSAALLIDLGALDGAHGRVEMKTARRLVLDGLVHAAASDAHSPEDQGAVASGWPGSASSAAPRCSTSSSTRIPAGSWRASCRSHRRHDRARVWSRVGGARGKEITVKPNLLFKLLASLIVGVVCVFYALHGMNRHEVLADIRALPLDGVLLYLGTLAITHFFRSWRWNYLLRPLGAALPLRRLLPVSSVGFMAILALPIRLGEFVRPYFVTREGRIRMSAAVGTVAVERIVDGLLISILFFVSYLLSSPDVFSPELRVGAWLSLIGFVGLTTFLAVAQAWTEPTIGLVLRFTLLRRFAPARAERLGDRLRSLISGFRVMRDRRNFTIFLVQSIIYWGANGFGMWILARQMDLPISLSAAFTTMAFTGVVLTLPNSPGLVGQFHAAIKLGLAAYLPLAVVNSKGMAYAIVLHGIQTLWYVTTGLASLLAISGGPGATPRSPKPCANPAAPPIAAPRSARRAPRLRPGVEAV